MKKRYVIRLTPEEREHLEGVVHRGRQAAYRRRHAQVLLLADQGEHGQGLIDREVAERLDCSQRTAEKIRERSRVLDGESEARLVSLACSEPPAGRARWTLRLLSDRLVELEVVESISAETVRKVLKKHHQTLAEADVVYSRATQRGVRLPDGSGAGGLSTPH